MKSIRFVLFCCSFVLSMYDVRRDRGLLETAGNYTLHRAFRERPAGQLAATLISHPARYHICAGSRNSLGW